MQRNSGSYRHGNRTESSGHYRELVFLDDLCFEVFL